MTKNTKKENKRAKTKFPALNKGVNLSSRKDYIEAEYINGTFDNDGKKVIRELTEDEKAWLNKWYEEAVITNFYHDKDLKLLNKMKKSIIEDETVEDLKKEVKNLQQNKKKNAQKIKQLKEIIHLTKKQNEETYSDKLSEIEEELEELRKEKLLYPDKEDHKQFYNENNARNNCIFNKSRISGKLVDFDILNYDEITWNKLQSIDIEDVIINDIEGEVHKEQDERINDIILEEIKLLIENKNKS